MSSLSKFGVSSSKASVSRPMASSSTESSPHAQLSLRLYTTHNARISSLPATLYCSPGHKSRKSPGKADGDAGEFDDAMSSASYDTNDTYGSGLDYHDAAPGGGAGNRAEGSYPSGGDGGGEEKNSKVVDDFKDAVDQLTEKR